MAKRRCAACGCLFVPRRNVPHQCFCAKRAYQRARRRRWQRQKLKDDAHFRANQAAAQRRWSERHPAYWRDYRQCHPDSTERNREQQRVRNRRRPVVGAGGSSPVIAKRGTAVVVVPDPDNAQRWVLIDGYRRLEALQHIEQQPLSTRALKRLYKQYEKATKVQRQRLVENPGLFLKALDNRDQQVADQRLEQALVEVADHDR